MKNKILNKNNIIKPINIILLFIIKNEKLLII